MLQALQREWDWLADIDYLCEQLLTKQFQIVKKYLNLLGLHHFLKECHVKLYPDLPYSLKIILFQLLSEHF